MSLNTEVNAEVMRRLHFEADITLENIGRAFGCTREYVRQVLVKRGFGTLGTGEVRRRHANTRAQKLLATPDFITAVHSGMPVSELRQRFGWGVGTAFKRISEFDKFERLAVAGRKRGERQTKYPKAMMIEAIYALSGGGKYSPVRRDYDAQRREGQPTSARLLQAFGSWNNALAAAGLRPSGRMLRRDMIPTDTLLDALEQSVTEGKRPSFDRYNEFAASRGLPCGETIRLRFFGWINAWRAVDERAKAKNVAET